MLLLLLLLTPLLLATILLLLLLLLLIPNDYPRSSCVYGTPYVSWKNRLWLSLRRTVFQYGIEVGWVWLRKLLCTTGFNVNLFRSQPTSKFQFVPKEGQWAVSESELEVVPWFPCGLERDLVHCQSWIVKHLPLLDQDVDIKGSGLAERETLFELTEGRHRVLNVVSSTSSEGQLWY